MKSTGYVKQLDNIGRIELPRTLMHELSINYRTALEIFNDSDSIVLMEHKDHCSICNNEDNLKSFKGKYICEDCIDGVISLQSFKIGS